MFTFRYASHCLFWMVLCQTYWTNSMIWPWNSPTFSYDNFCVRFDRRMVQTDNHFRSWHYGCSLDTSVRESSRLLALLIAYKPYLTYILVFLSLLRLSSDQFDMDSIVESSRPVAGCGATVVLVVMLWIEAEARLDRLYSKQK
ncbi:hypothetical protein H5410_011798 [Solanum commersonii]|uniref:Uncharacterized protein n=1 Tax=Solanum commersonii TaxID=4109 RepID=A0A9J6AQF1_SOLCO|nr:hypothetical protein H5410_011798 [Solanum commersonii]